VASLTNLALAGAASITYFETTGWRGLLEPEAGEGRPEAFPSWPGEVFPAYHVLADAGEWREERALLIETSSSNPLASAALVVRTDRTLYLLIANLEPAVHQVVVLPVPNAEARVRTLDEVSFELAARDPAAFRAASEIVEIRDGRIELELQPYGVARIDIPVR
jgi:hypothetical protein